MLLLSAPPCLVLPPRDAPRQAAEVRAAFDRFVAAQNGHDLESLAPLLSSSPAFLWITQGAPVWGRDEALKRFSLLYAGTWRLEPETSSFRLVADRPGMVQLFVPIRFTVGPTGQPPREVRFLMNQTWVQEDGGWRLLALLPIPAAASPAGK